MHPRSWFVGVFKIILLLYWRDKISHCKLEKDSGYLYMSMLLIAVRAKCKVLLTAHLEIQYSLRLRYHCIEYVPNKNV